MTGEEIPRERWGEFLEQYSVRHRGENVKVSFVETASGESHTSEDRPGTLERIAPDRLRAGDFDIILRASRGPGEHVLETIHEPMKIVVQGMSDGVEEGLRIDSKSGSTTVLTFGE